MAMAAADPSPAAVMTWARGLATLPATQTPGTLVRPVGVGDDPAVLVEVAAETDQQVVVRDEPRRDEQRVRGTPRPSSSSTPVSRSSSTDDPRRRRPRRCRWPGPRAARARSRCSVPAGREEHDVVGPLADDLRVADRLGRPPSTPSGWSRTS